MKVDKGRLRVPSAQSNLSNASASQGSVKVALPSSQQSSVNSSQEDESPVSQASTSPSLGHQYNTRGRRPNKRNVPETKTENTASATATSIRRRSRSNSSTKEETGSQVGAGDQPKKKLKRNEVANVAKTTRSSVDAEAEMEINATAAAVTAVVNVDTNENGSGLDDDILLEQLGVAGGRYTPSVLLSPIDWTPGGSARVLHRDGLETVTPMAVRQTILPSTGNTSAASTSPTPPTAPSSRIPVRPVAATDKRPGPWTATKRTLKGTDVQRYPQSQVNGTVSSPTKIAKGVILVRNISEVSTDREDEAGPSSGAATSPKGRSQTQSRNQNRTPEKKRRTVRIQDADSDVEFIDLASDSPQLTPVKRSVTANRNLMTSPNSTPGGNHRPKTRKAGLVFKQRLLPNTQLVVDDAGRMFCVIGPLPERSVDQSQPPSRGNGRAKDRPDLLNIITHMDSAVQTLVGHLDIAVNDIGLLTQIRRKNGPTSASEVSGNEDEPVIILDDDGFGDFNLGAVNGNSGDANGTGVVQPLVPLSVSNNDELQNVTLAQNRMVSETGEGTVEEDHSEMDTDTLDKPPRGSGRGGREVENVEKEDGEAEMYTTELNGSSDSDEQTVQDEGLGLDDRTNFNTVEQLDSDEESTAGENDEEEGELLNYPDMGKCAIM